MHRFTFVSLAALAIASCADQQSSGSTEREISSRGGVSQEVLLDNPAVVGDLIRLSGFEFGRLASRPIDVWLPPGYDANSDRHYPVLYMHDGQNIFDPQHSKYSGEEWGVDEAITKLAAAGEIEPAIVVGIWSLPDSRFYELMPQAPVEENYGQGFGADGENLDPGVLLGDAYLSFVAETLKPYIDAQFRTKPGQDHTFIMGSSMGGLMSCYAMTERPEIFGGGACVSTHWPIGEGLAAEYFIEHLPPPGSNRIYFDFGTETLDAAYEPFQRRIDAAMVEAGYIEGDDWLTVKDDGAAHSEVAWRARVHLPLTFLLRTD